MKRNEIKSYRDLIVWQKGIEFAKELYSVTHKLPDDERYGMVSQIRRSAVSVPSNIAEGQARRTPKAFVQFLYISRGSLAELDTQLTLSYQFSYIEKDEYFSLIGKIEELQKMLFSLITKLGGSK
jgi:four helix bundle protein